MVTIGEIVGPLVIAGALVGGGYLLVQEIEAKRAEYERDRLEWIANHETAVNVTVDSGSVRTSGNGSQGLRFSARTADGNSLKCKADYHLEGDKSYDGLADNLRRMGSSQVQIKGYAGESHGCENDEGYFMITAVQSKKLENSVNN